MRGCSSHGRRCACRCAVIAFGGIVIKLEIKQEDWAIDGSFIIARGAATEARVVTVSLDDGKDVGRGECEPQDHYGESLESVIEQIESVRTALENGMSRLSLQTTLPPGAARNAVDCALWDLEAKRSGRRAWQLAGLAQAPAETTVYTISLDTPEKMAAQASDYTDWPILKLKLGGGIDVERVTAVREAVPGVRFIVDANESWSLEDLINFAPQLRALGVELIEQPLPAGQDAELAGLDLPLPICADESCHTVDSLASIQGLYDFVNIKLDKTGGLTEALRLASAAQEMGFRLMTGCMTGTSLAMAPATIIAAMSDYVDLDGPLLLLRDRKPGIHYEKGQMFPVTEDVWG